MNGRFYDPVIGRFLSGLLEIWGGELIGLHPFFEKWSSSRQGGGMDLLNGSIRQNSS